MLTTRNILDLDKIISGHTDKILTKTGQQIWKTKQWPKTRDVQYISQFSRKKMPRNVVTTVPFIVLMSHASIAMQQRHLPYMEREMLDVQAEQRKGKDTQDLIMSICWTMECHKEFQKEASLCFID